MGVFDVFRPRWKRSDPEVRLAAVRRFGPGDEQKLDEVVRTDADPRVRRVAIKKIDDPVVLEAVAASDADELVRTAAAEKAGELLLAAAVEAGREREARAACERLTSPRALADVARRAAHETVRQQALARLDDQKLLGEVALAAADPQIRTLAFARLVDPAALREVAVAPDASKGVALDAIARLEDPAALEAVADRAKNKVVRGAARARLKALRAATPRDREADEQREAALAAQRQHAAEQAARAAEEQRRREGALTAARTARAEQAILRERQRREAEAQEAAARAALAEEKAARERELNAKAAEEAQARAEQAARREQERALQQEERARRKAEREAELAALRERLERLVGRVEELVSSEDLRRVQAILKETQEAFRDAGRTAAELRERYETAREKLVRRAQELRETDEWRRWANSPRLEALVARVEALRDDAAVESKELALQLKAAQAEWKKLGVSPPKLWTRFKAACDQVHERARSHFAELGEQRQTNLQKKEELCARAEAASESSDWKVTTELLKQLQQEWRTVGPVPREQSDAVWKRFRSACDHFFERRVAAVELTDEEKQANLSRMAAIVTEAEALKDSTEWKPAAERLKVLQGEWKRSGTAPRAESEALWQRFRDACDHFFARRKADLDQREGEREVSLRQKEALCQKAEELALAAGRGEGPADPEAAASALMAEWKLLGPAPRTVSNAVWQRFRTACDRLRRGPEPEAGVPAESEGAPKFESRLPVGVLKVPPVPPSDGAAEEKPEE